MTVAQYVIRCFGSLPTAANAVNALPLVLYSSRTCCWQQTCTYCIAVPSSCELSSSKHICKLPDPHCANLTNPTANIANCNRNHQQKPNTCMNSTAGKHCNTTHASNGRCTQRRTMLTALTWKLVRLSCCGDCASNNMYSHPSHAETERHPNKRGNHHQCTGPYYILLSGTPKLTLPLRTFLWQKTLAKKCLHSGLFEIACINYEHT